MVALMKSSRTFRFLRQRDECMTESTVFERAGEWLATRVTLRPKLTLVLGFLLCVAGGMGLCFARFSADYRIFFSHEDPGLASFQKLEAVFTQTDNVLFVVHPSQGTVFERDALQAVKELTE